MYRAQVLLEEIQYRQLQRLAIRQRKRLSQILREWIAEKLAQLAGKQGDSLHAAAGMLKGHVKERVDVRRLDRYIYKKDW